MKRMYTEPTLDLPDPPSALQTRRQRKSRVGLRTRILALCLLAAGVRANQSLPEALIEAGHWKKARALVEARIGANPRDALACFLLSQVRNAFGDHESPLGLAEQAVALDGGVAKYHRQIAEAVGVAAQHSGIFQQLILARRFKKEIDAAIALDPRDLQALRDLMEFYLLAPGIAGGDSAKARETAARIAAIDPAEGYAAQARLAESSGERNRIEDLLHRAAEAKPRDYRMRIALAEFYVTPEHRDLAGAEREASEAVRIDPSRAPAYAVLARCYAAGERWIELDSTLATAGRESSDDLAPNYRAAEVLLGANRALDRAAGYLRTYLSVEPEGNEPTLAEAHWKLGLVLEKLGRAHEAAAEWREAVRLDSASPAARDLKRVKD
jgi:tetratricopeptide (TPR) repeat protein